jgi:hypothetical protein
VEFFIICQILNFFNINEVLDVWNLGSCFMDFMSFWIENSNVQIKFQVSRGECFFNNSANHNNAVLNNKISMSPTWNAPIGYCQGCNRNISRIWLIKTSKFRSCSIKFLWKIDSGF